MLALISEVLIKISFNQIRNYILFNLSSEAKSLFLFYKLNWIEYSNRPVCKLILSSNIVANFKSMN